MLIGMSQEKLGELLGVTFQQIQKYEKGTNRVSASRLHQMSRILGVSVQFFFDEIPNAQTPNAQTSHAGAGTLGQAASHGGRRPGGHPRSEAGPVNGAGDNGSGGHQSGPETLAFLSNVQGLQLNRCYTNIASPKVRQCFLDLVMSLGEEAEEQSGSRR